IAGDDARQHLRKAVGLGGGALAVDQHVAGIAGKAARSAAAIERKAGQAVDHVPRRGRTGGGEEIGRVAFDLVLGPKRRGDTAQAKKRDCPTGPPHDSSNISFSWRIVARAATGDIAKPLTRHKTQNTPGWESGGAARRKNDA